LGTLFEAIEEQKNYQHQERPGFEGSRDVTVANDEICLRAEGDRKDEKTDGQHARAKNARP
jgi:hypothetical protein